MNNSTGSYNTANGVNALWSNSSGNYNTASGVQALFDNYAGDNNTANGANALANNTSGGNNTASGSRALFMNTTGIWNTADGVNALLNNTTGEGNTANGVNALKSNTTGDHNTANGVNAPARNGSGHRNTALGTNALLFNAVGSNNIAVGFQAGQLLHGDNNIDTGNPGVAAEGETIRIKSSQTRTFIAGISGATASGGAAVFVNSDGQLGTSTSSQRFKDQIKPMDKASEALFALNPVSFRYKKEINPERIPQFGLVAEEVEKVNPDLVVRDADGKPYTVRYEAVNAMLLNEFRKEHRRVQELEKQVEKLTAGLQKVSDQLELNKPAPQTVVNNQ